MIFEKTNEIDHITNLIRDYKNYISESKMEDEVYKWQLVKEFKARPDTNAVDFTKEIKSVKFKNMIYAMSGAVIYHLANDVPEELREIFKVLYDETKPLKERIIYFNSESLKLYRSIGEELGHHQDERSMATYLTYHNPNKYTFYKSSFYKELCKLTGVKPAGKNEKYIHYLEILHQFIEEYIEKDQELIDQVRTFIPEYYDGKNHLLLAQDILYCMLNKSKDVIDPDYWVFQGNPDIYDINTAIKDKKLETWSVKSHKTKIKIGDKIILWFTGGKSGCYALAEVSSELFNSKESIDDRKYYLKDPGDEISDKVKIKITHDLTLNPILRETAFSNPLFQDFKGGFQGTNFSATKEQYEALLNIQENMNNKKYWLFAPGEGGKMWEEFFSDGIMGLGWDTLSDLKQYSSKFEIAEKLRQLDDSTEPKTNDALANFEFANKINIGDTIIVKKGRRKLLGYGIVTSEYYFDETRANYKQCRKVDWILNGEWLIDHSFNIKTLTNISSYSSEHPDYEFYYQQLLANMNTNILRTKKEITPINRILYGPPGTGKTYHLKEELFPLYTTKESSVTRDEFILEIVKDMPWWKIIAMVISKEAKVKVSDVRNHEFILAKERSSNSNSINQTIWGQLQSHTVLHCEDVKYKSKQSPLVFFKNEDSTWNLDVEGFEQVEEEIKESLEKINDFEKVSDIEIKRYEFVTFHQSYSYEDFIEGIKPVMGDESEGEIQYEIKDGIFKRLCQRAGNDTENTYAIFIDEINRGNVSSIFGELITLIEDDKRLGSKNEMTATLPYSRQKNFGVPKNLHIYGTMNTADRSVEAIDTALRRRFSFQERMPDPELLADKQIEGIQLDNLLRTINERIQALIDRDHTIGHAYLINVKNIEDLRLAFKDKIIPLLQEYFYGDYGKIGLVLGNGFVENKEPKENLFASFEYEGSNSLTQSSFDLIPFEDIDFEEALTKLMNK